MSDTSNSADVNPTVTPAPSTPAPSSPLPSSDPAPSTPLPSSPVPSSDPAPSDPAPAPSAPAAPAPKFSHGDIAKFSWEDPIGEKSRYGMVLDVDDQDRAVLAWLEVSGPIPIDSLDKGLDAES